MKLFLSLFLISFSMASLAQLPSVPTDARHPGSKIYNYGFKNEHLQCSGRDVEIYLPVSARITSEEFPVIVYGHGQALNVDHYRATLEHLAKKGIVVVFPNYDKGFFDRDWRRMGRDYVNLTDCALKIVKDHFYIMTSNDQILFSGHSKGAYVASVAAGMAFKEGLAIKPKSVLLFEAAGLDAETNAAIDPSVMLTVIYSDKDSIVSKKISDDIIATTPSLKKQFIFLKSYPELIATHFWPLTKSSAVGGGPESSYHYYSAWKWLVAAAMDLKIGGSANNPYLYGEQASDKGVPNLQDEITRSW